MCINISSLSCDFTSNVTPFGTYTLRLRTELNERSSVWIEINCEPVEEISEWIFSGIIFQILLSVKLLIIYFSAAVIGSPVVRLQSRKGKMEVDITDPVVRKSSLKDFYSNISYRIRYWTKGEMKKVMIRI